MDYSNEQGTTVPFSDRLLEMLDRAATACADQWPDSDSPAATCRTVHTGVKNGLNEISDLKRKLSDSIAREQEIGRKLKECRAHADALAMHLGDYVYADGDPDKDEAIADLTAYRKYKEPGE